MNDALKRALTQQEAADELTPRLPTMTISSIAYAVRQHWPKVYFGAVPYLDAMLREDYGFDGEESVLLYFLSNATTWRGPVARVVKAELKRRVGR